MQAPPSPCRYASRIIRHNRSIARAITCREETVDELGLSHNHPDNRRIAYRKTLLVQHMLEEHGYPYLPIDHLNMDIVALEQPTLSSASPYY